MTNNSTRIQGNYQELYIGYHSCDIGKIFIYFTVAKKLGLKSMMRSLHLIEIENFDLYHLSIKGPNKIILFSLKNYEQVNK